MQKRLSAFPLKVVAIIAMLINHIGSGFNLHESLYGFYIFSLIIGKLTFPIMAYLLTEGYRKTRDVKRYVLRLAVFWILSIVPFWLTFYYPEPFTPIQLVNNVMFTLLMGLLLLIVTDRVENGFMRGLLVIVFSLLTISSDWPVMGVLMIYGFYRIKKPVARVVAPILYTIGIVMILALLSAAGATAMGMDIVSVVIEFLVFLGLLLVIPLLLMYNGERGYSPGWVKWGFYIFYPLHLAIIGLLAM